MEREEETMSRSGTKKPRVSRKMLYPRPSTDFQPGTQLQHITYLFHIYTLSIKYLHTIYTDFQPGTQLQLVLEKVPSEGS